MRSRPRDALLLFLCLLPLHGLDGRWATPSLAAEGPLRPLQDSLEDRAADRLAAEGTPLDRETPLAALAQEEIPTTVAVDDPQGSRILGTLPPLPEVQSTAGNADRVLISVSPLGSVEGPSVVQSHETPSARGSFSPPPHP